jgi:cyclopropane-fatty-acyl-phospholipid synthase
MREVLKTLGYPAIDFVLWNGERFGRCSQAPVGRVEIHDRGALWRLLLDPDRHFGDLYSAGRVTVEGDLVACLKTAYRTLGSGPRLRFLKRAFTRLHRGHRLHSRSGSRTNVHHHYDIGNDFYALWLDREYLQYSCAYYPRSDMTLEQAQAAKLDHICRKLRLRPGEEVIDAGCGWGGLARFMAKRYGVRVKAYSLSHEQVTYARERSVAEGLEDRVEFIEDDYRNIRGECDAFVSVGMLEHVGVERYREFGSVVERCLKDDGRCLVHAIGRNQATSLNSWIETQIFPGACPPSLGQMMELCEPRNFSVLDVENLRLHYARTVEQWLQRFEKNVERVRANFGDPFVRTWRLYLAGSVAAFTAGYLQLFQLVFARARNNDLPWSRAHLYNDEGHAEPPDGTL